MLINDIQLAELNNPKQHIKARVELFNGSTLEKICNCQDLLKQFSIDKTGLSKFFGVGICQKLSAEIIDINRELNITKEHTIEASFGVVDNFVYPCPNFYVEEVNRNEESNTITITAYDALYKASNYTVAELDIPSDYSIKTFAAACAAKLGVPIAIDSAAEPSFLTYYASGANFDGSETLREALDKVAEATQTIYYINSKWELTFKRLDISGEALLTLSRDKYSNLETSTVNTLTAICHATELGDNIITGSDTAGATQYVRNNPFWDLRSDTAQLVDNALAAAGGLVLTNFICEDWAGNYLLELGDKIALETESGEYLTSYILDDSIKYDGTFFESTKCEYIQDEAESAVNPSSLGEALNKTFARVDKVNNEIVLLSSEASANKTDLQRIEQQVELKVTPQQLEIAVSEALSGVNGVTTETGFTFDKDGLTVAQEGQEISTQITIDGMTVNKGKKALLTANNGGVNAQNLHATTYLIIGKNSRFEDYKTRRTGCFWIGK